MNDRHVRARANLRHTAEIAGCDDVGGDALDIDDFADAQFCCEIRLKQIVGSGRTAADVALRDRNDIETGARE